MHTVLNPLNVPLFRQLQARFGEVKIANEGQYEVVQTVPHPRVPGLMITNVIARGEQYRVCCPYCGDRRYRLYISYKWNTANSLDSKANKYKIFCQNEQCSMQNFQDELKAYFFHGEIPRPAMKVEPFAAHKQVEFPGNCVSLKDLPADHVAVRYLASRHFDHNKIAEKWGVMFCTAAPCDERGFIPDTRIVSGLVTNRLIIPIMWEGKMVGWQARALDAKTSVKYYTMPGLNKSHLLYNGDVARKHSFGVIVEGVTDAWRVGERAVALLGKTISQQQLMLLYTFWSKGGCCLFLDEDAHQRDKKRPGTLSAAEKAISMINPSGFVNGFFSVSPPVGFDPGSMTYEDIWGLISNDARSRGIQIFAS